MPPKTARQLDRFSQFGLVAGRLALDDAGLSPGRRRRRRPPSASGSTSARRWAASPTPRSSTSAISSSGIRQVAPNLALAVFGGAAPANLGIALDVRGPILSTANSCASGAVALGEALGDLREGRVDAAIAGGCEIPLSPLAFGAFDIIRALSAGHNDDPGDGRPAVRCRSRRLRHGRGRRAARARGRRGRRPARARRRTPSCSAMARRPTRTTWSSRAPTAAEAARAATIALADAAVERDEIDYVNAHASSTPIGDVAEARAIALALGGRAGDVPVSGTKALYGHPLGASGAIEAAICALAIRDGWAPASVNLDDARPGVADLLPGLLRAGRDGAYRRVLSTSFGFGGLNAALVFGAGRLTGRLTGPSALSEGGSVSGEAAAVAARPGRRRARRPSARRRRRALARDAVEPVAAHPGQRPAADPTAEDPPTASEIATTEERGDAAHDRPADRRRPAKIVV